MSIEPQASEDQLGLNALVPYTLPERVIDPELIPWIPTQHPGIVVKPLRLNRKTGLWTTLLKVSGSMMISRHYHVGAVTAIVVEGSWYYEEKDWVARQGMVVWEPPGDVHTLIGGDDGTLTYFMLEGALLYVDENHNVVGFDDVLSYTKLYQDHCAAEGIKPLDLDY